MPILLPGSKKFGIYKSALPSTKINPVHLLDLDLLEPTRVYLSWRSATHCIGRRLRPMRYSQHPAALHHALPGEET